MFKWVQGSVSALTGTAEPVYGKEAIHPVTDTVKNKNPFSEATRDDFKWQVPNHTNVETQVFYFTCPKTGYIGFVQLIHSNVGGVHITGQFTFRLYHKDDPKKSLVWTSTALTDFQPDETNFYADNLAFELNGEGTEYSIKSLVNEDSIVDLKVTKTAPAFKVGKDGVTTYGNDPEAPWGTMRHIFWPRSKCEGTLIVKGETLEIEGTAMFVMALQGMKPHHAASSWNFLNFQGPTLSAVQMEFTTPPSYDNTRVTIGVVVQNDKILFGSVDNEAITNESEEDDIGWPVPKSMTFKFSGPIVESTDKEVENKTAKIATAVVEAKLDKLVERVDVMGEIPGIVKKVVSGVAGTKPFIYQFCNDMNIEVSLPGADKPLKESGIGYSEATFIS